MNKYALLGSRPEEKWKESKVDNMYFNVSFNYKPVKFMAAMSTPPTYDEGGPTYDGVHHMIDRDPSYDGYWIPFFKMLLSIWFLLI